MLRGFIVLVPFLAICFSHVDESERKVLATGSDLRVRVADLKAGKLRLFAYAVDPATTTQVVVRRGEDGIIRLALGSCRSCQKFDHYKWFNKLVCRIVTTPSNCRTRTISQPRRVAVLLSLCPTTLRLANSSSVARELWASSIAGISRPGRSRKAPFSAWGFSKFS